MIEEAQKTIDILRQKAKRNVCISTSPESMRRLAKLIEKLMLRVQELEGKSERTADHPAS